MNLDELLSETSPDSPIAPIAPPSGVVLDRARERLHTAAGSASIAPGTATSGVVPSIGGRTELAAARRRRPRRRVLVAAAGVAAAALIVSPVVGLAGREPTASANAAELMLQFAATAEAQADPWPAGQPYWHTDSEIYYSGEGSHRRETWISREGRSALYDESFSADVEPERRGDDGIHVMDLGSPTTYSVGTQSILWSDLTRLPTDPTTLAAYLTARRPSIRSASSEQWDMVVDLLLSSEIPSDLRKALWEVASTTPGVESGGEVTDAAGRPGVAIELDMTGDGWYRDVLVVDPGTGQLLEREEYDGDGALSYRMTFLESGPTDTAPPVDPPSCGPGSVPERSC